MPRFDHTRLIPIADNLHFVLTSDQHPNLFVILIPINTLAMTRVQLSTIDNTAGGSRRTSQSSSDGNFTPAFSTPGPGGDQVTAPRTDFTFRFRFSPDTALPSVESPSANERVQNPSTPPRPNPPIPSLSISSSDSTSNGTSHPTSDGEQGSSASSLDSQLGGLRLSSPTPGIDMQPVSDALRDVEAGRDSRSRSSLSFMSPSPVSLSPARRGARSRRSSSQTNLAKHDVRQETPPNDRFNIPAVQQALRDTKWLMSELANVLGRVHIEPDSVMARIHRQTEDLAAFECPPTRTVGFVGDSGAGKSSLINSLLDCPDLARSSNGGGACTCVVTEFHFHGREEFNVVVEVFSDAELNAQIENLLQDYRHFHLNRDSFESHEIADLERRARTASDTFETMFSCRFPIETVLLRGSESEVLSTLISVARDFDRESMLEPRDGLTLADCSDVLMKLASDTSSERPLWPWIKKIKVYSNAHILSKGLILVDLPGLHDSNSARRNITERYLLEGCDEIFVVSAEGRVTTDEGVRSVIEIANQARLSSVGIICTRSDEIKPTEALRDWRGMRAATEIRRKLRDIDQDKLDVAKLLEDISQLEELDYEELTDAERDELNRKNSRFRSITRRLNDRKFDLQKFLITTRNGIVERKLIDKYEHEVPGNSLKVFCASNQIYWAHREEPSNRSMPYLKLSGILAIREHCMTMVSESQYKSAAKYMRDDTGALLGDLNLWVQSGHGSLDAEKKAEIRETLDAMEEKLDLELCGHASILNQTTQSYKDEFKTLIYQAHRHHVNRWSAAAKTACEDWSGMHHSTYAAFVRNYGTHYTPVAGSRCWNGEMVKEMKNDLSPAWEELRTSLDDQGETILESINDLFDEAGELLDTRLVSSRDTVTSIRSTLLSRKRLLKAEIEESLKDLQSNLRTLRTDALSGIRTSFVGKIMESGYNEARRESGRGSDARRKAIITSAVRQDGLFAGMLRDFKTGFSGHVDDTQERIQEVAKSHFEAIQDTFDIVRSENAASEFENNPEFRTAVEERLRATREEMERIHNIIAT
ncbi:hypothetical protein F5Y10DRAFT_249982 [Nemania abortiva]|nr:hypothetical protein F5Y10DRAFT_249982 [Nemania abortiva]